MTDYKTRHEIRLMPSLICLDLCNLESSVRELESIGVDMLHVDILDGHFSPSMPIGIDTVAQLRKKTNLHFDAHLMVESNEFFIEQMISIKCERICFHLETAKHPDLLLRTIKKADIKAGIALKPSTPIHLLEDIIYECDYILLMMINPGYAGQNSEVQITYAREKIKKCMDLIDKSGLNIPIQVDGRVSLENLPMLLKNGATDIVCGTGTLFRDGYSLMENHNAIMSVIRKTFD